MKKIKKTKEQQFIERVNGLEVKEIYTDYDAQLVIRCVNHKGSTVLLFRKDGGVHEEQTIEGDYDELLKSDRFAVGIIRTLAKTGDLSYVVNFLKWHEYKKNHMPEDEEPEKVFTLRDLWELHLCNAYGEYEDILEEEG